MSAPASAKSHTKGEHGERAVCSEGSEEARRREEEKRKRKKEKGREKEREREGRKGKRKRVPKERKGESEWKEEERPTLNYSKIRGRVSRTYCLSLSRRVAATLFLSKLRYARYFPVPHASRCHPFSTYFLSAWCVPFFFSSSLPESLAPPSIALFFIPRLCLPSVLFSSSFSSSFSLFFHHHLLFFLFFFFFFLFSFFYRARFLEQ